MLTKTGATRVPGGGLALMQDAQGYAPRLVRGFDPGNDLPRSCAPRLRQASGMAPASAGAPHVPRERAGANNGGARVSDAPDIATLKLVAQKVARHLGSLKLRGQAPPAPSAVLG